jgi:hypothetical protein
MKTVGIFASTDKGKPQKELEKLRKTVQEQKKAIAMRRTKPVSKGLKSSIPFPLPTLLAPLLINYSLS